MDKYNFDEGENYNVKSDYSNSNASVLNQGSYVQSTQILPIYRTQTQQQNSTPKKSKCPRGAKLGEIGSCCGFECSRACAFEC